MIAKQCRKSNQIKSACDFWMKRLWGHQGNSFERRCARFSTCCNIVGRQALIITCIDWKRFDWILVENRWCLWHDEAAQIKFYRRVLYSDIRSTALWFSCMHIWLRNTAVLVAHHKRLCSSWTTQWTVENGSDQSACWNDNTHCLLHGIL